MKRIFPVLVSVFCLLPIVATAEVASWPEFRGPTGDGKADGNIPLVIDDSVVKWKVDIHGKGWSSPVVWGNQIWLTTATEDGKQMFVICVDRQSGKIVHDKLLISSEKPDFCHPMTYRLCVRFLQASSILVESRSMIRSCAGELMPSGCYRHRNSMHP